MMDDTHPQARRVQIELLRQAGPQRRLQMTIGLTDHVLRLSQRGIAQAQPKLSAIERNLLFVRVHYGRAIAEQMERYLKRRNRI